MDNQWLMLCRDYFARCVAENKKERCIFEYCSELDLFKKHNLKYLEPTYYGHYGCGRRIPIDIFNQVIEEYTSNGYTMLGRESYGVWLEKKQTTQSIKVKEFKFSIISKILYYIDICLY